MSLYDCSDNSINLLFDAVNYSFGFKFIDFKTKVFEYSVKQIGSILKVSLRLDKQNQVICISTYPHQGRLVFPPCFFLQDYLNASVISLLDLRSEWCVFAFKFVLCCWFRWNRRVEVSFNLIDKLLWITWVVYRFKCFSLLFGSMKQFSSSRLIASLLICSASYFRYSFRRYLACNLIFSIRVWEFNDIFILLLVQLFQFLVIVPGLAGFRFRFQRKHIIRGLVNRFD